MYENLMLEMERRRVTIRALADALGIHRNSVRNKLYGPSDFTLREAMCAHDRFFADCDFAGLFARMGTDAAKGGRAIIQEHRGETI